MRTAYTISAVGHAAVLLWSVWSFAAKPLPVTPGDALPVDIVSVSEFTQMTAGNKSAPKAETPKPLVEKVAEAKPVEDTTAKVVEKKEVKAALEPPPAPETKPVEAKPETKPAETKPDPIAEALKKDQAKKPEPKKAEAKPPTPPKKPAPPAPQFDPHKVEALLNKQIATRLAAAGDVVNSTPSLGLPNARAEQLSLSELDALRQKLMRLWRPPESANPKEMICVFAFKLRRDGTLADAPTLVSSGKSSLGVIAREAAARAIFAGQPYDMLKPEHYDVWKEVEVTFDPRDMPQ
jgi:outer membrane biosynthesis protein TonB